MHIFWTPFQDSVLDRVNDFVPRDIFAMPQLQLSWLALASLIFTKSSHPPTHPHPPPPTRKSLFLNFI